MKKHLKYVEGKRKRKAKAILKGNVCDNCHFKANWSDYCNHPRKRRSLPKERTCLFFKEKRHIDWTTDDYEWSIDN